MWHSNSHSLIHYTNRTRKRKTEKSQKEDIDNEEKRRCKQQ